MTMRLGRGNLEKGIQFLFSEEYLQFIIDHSSTEWTVITISTASFTAVGVAAGHKDNLNATVKANSALQLLFI